MRPLAGIEPLQLLHGAVHVHGALRLEHHPTVRERLPRRQPLRRGHAQQARDEVLRLLRLVRPGVAVEVEDAVAYVVQHQLVVVLGERVVPAQPTRDVVSRGSQDVGDHA